MDYLREGIGLRAMAQRDPLVEYQREGGDMFATMMAAFMEEVVGFVFHLEVEVERAPSVGVVTGGDGRAVQIGARGIGAAGNGDHAAPEPGPIVESGPDPDDFGVAVHAVDGEEVPEEAEELVAAVESESESVLRPQVRAKGLGSDRSRRLSYSAPDEDGSVKTVGQATAALDEYAGVGRNAPCPCGSGKKFKLCHARAGG
jgi:preprotein translocase subunit SecA